MELDGEIDVDQAGQREESREHNPTRERRRIDRVECFSARCVHLIFSATRSFALRERGLTRCSVSPGSTGFAVTNCKSKSGFGRGSGHSGRSSHSRLRSRKKFFTMRSSSEWKVMTAMRAAEFEPIRQRAQTLSKAPSSSFTSMRNAWKTWVAG